MNDTQLTALRHFVALMDGDEVAQADLDEYGNAYEHLNDYLVDILIDQGIYL